ncbi:MAG: antirestriction protein ArdA [Sulfuricurvum sp.]|nr:antirestriction protein ArdA [Sulfuricurvum sp.]MDP3022723.1 antirestriction protein ArdA [Sulfuricurvum sp.]
MLKIYVSDLAAYNSGRLIGEWIDLPCSDIADSIQAVLLEGQRVCKDALPHEEFFITDFEWEDTGMGKACSVSEYSDPYKLNQIAEELSALDEFERLQVQFLLYEGYEFEYALQNHDDVTIYDYRSSTSFKDVYELLAEDLVDEGCFGDIPSNLTYYIDYSAIGRDLSMDYTEFEHGLLGRAS